MQNIDDISDDELFDDEELDFSASKDENSNDGELREHYRLTVDAGQTSLRVDKFLFNKISGISRNKIQDAAQAGCIFVDNIAVKSSYKVKPGNEVVVKLPYEHHDFKIEPENIPLDIVYEDDDLIVVNKPAGIVVHPAHGNYTGTLVNALAYYLGQNCSFDKDDIRPGLVHRIDKNTSGLLVIAKNEFSKAHLAKQFFDHTVNRRYQALVWGDFKEACGTVEGNIGRNPKDRKSMFVFADGSNGKPAVTHWKVLERFGYVTLIECKLETGRTHQIRVHMKFITRPLFNDEVYGGNKLLRGTTFAKYRKFVDNCFETMPRQALHAKTLEFIHPKTGKLMSFNSELPDDFKIVLAKWRAYSTAVQSVDNDI